MKCHFYGVLLGIGVAKAGEYIYKNGGVISALIWGSSGSDEWGSSGSGRWGS
jgi:hypothetical protein